MGQMVLSMAGAAVGSAIGGPMGAKIGWMLGGMAWSLLDPQKIQGPRLQDTKVKGADYGVMRPIVYGVARVGGIGMGQGSTSEGPNKFTEHEESSSGKGGPETTNYRYTLSFFDELCEGPIRGVMRRWGNGRLLNEVGGPSPDFPVTLYLGDATQSPDPTMETIYGAGEVCPMRGVAYEAIEELDVSDFGSARPVIEREVHTTPASQSLRIVKSNYDTGTGFWAPKPILVDWPLNGEAIVSNANNGSITTDLADAKTFDAESLANNGATDTASSGFEFPNGESSAGVGGWRGLGVHQTSAGPLALWWTQSHTGTVASSPVISTPAAFTDDIVGDAGVPGGLYVTSAALTQDGVALFIFTSTTSRTANASHWYKIVDLVVVADGTVSPSFDLSCYGVGCAVSQANGQGSFENNARYMWYAETDQSTVRLFYIDDSDNFAEWGGGTLSIPWPSPLDIFERSTLSALSTPGYAGAFKGASLVQLSRLGPPEKAILGDIVKDLLQRADRNLLDAQIDVTDLTQEVTGFVVGSQMTCKNAIDMLRRSYYFDVTEYDGKIVAVNRGHDAIATIPDGDLCAHVPGTEKPEPLETVRTPEAELPRTVFINYYDYDNDYQQGSQYWRRTVTSSQSDVTLDLPLVFTATEALLRAQWHMHFAWLERDQFTFYVTDEWAKLRPTNVVVVRGVNIRLTEVTEMPDGIIRCQGVRAFAGPYTAPITNPGGSGAPGGEVPGSPGSGQPPQTPPAAKADSAVILIDGPLVDEADSPTGIRAAIYKDSAGAWSGASLQKSVDGGTTYTSVASTATSASVGTVAVALPTFAGGNVIDQQNVIRVAMTNGATLTSTTEAGLQNGLNLIALGTVATGWEFLQYQTATLVSAGVWDLSGLLRGRYGTEWRMLTHAASELLVVMATTVPVGGAMAEIGLSRKWKAVTNGTAIADATAQDFTNTGVALKSWAPVLLGYGVDSSGDVILHCTPRRRGSGGWPDGVDLPATDPANWQWEIATDAGFTNVVRVIGTTVTEATFTVAMQTSDLGAPGLPPYWRVAQFSALGLGYFAKAST
jgi:hypothetical protein